MDSKIKLAIERSEDLIETAKDDFKLGHLLASVNRCYYAYFWLARTLLFKRDIFVKSHNGVKTKFSELFIKTGVVPEKYGRNPSELMNDRQDADYDLESDFTKEEVQEMIDWTEEFLGFVKDNIEKF
ncbi:MAG: HEPN domain-containing protein [Arcicella sp.]|jgi:uncharacterized protein (UPF0332 family)|nr:HEPN domain-containing protein [Arcicella sp.]